MMAVTELLNSFSSVDVLICSRLFIFELESITASGNFQTNSSKKLFWSWGKCGLRGFTLASTRMLWWNSSFVTESSKDSQDVSLSSLTRLPRWKLSHTTGTENNTVLEMKVLKYCGENNRWAMLNFFSRREHTLLEKNKGAYQQRGLVFRVIRAVPTPAVDGEGSASSTVSSEWGSVAQRQQWRQHDSKWQFRPSVPRALTKFVRPQHSVRTHDECVKLKTMTKVQILKQLPTFVAINLLPARISFRLSTVKTSHSSFQLHCVHFSLIHQTWRGESLGMNKHQTKLEPNALFSKIIWGLKVSAELEVWGGGGVVQKYRWAHSVCRQVFDLGIYLTNSKKLEWEGVVMLICATDSYVSPSLVWWKQPTEGHTLPCETDAKKWTNSACSEKNETTLDRPQANSHSFFGSSASFST